MVELDAEGQLYACFSHALARFPLDAARDASAAAYLKRIEVGAFAAARRARRAAARHSDDAALLEYDAVRTVLWRMLGGVAPRTAVSQQLPHRLRAATSAVRGLAAFLPGRQDDVGGRSQLQYLYDEEPYETARRAAVLAAAAEQRRTGGGDTAD